MEEGSRSLRSQSQEDKNEVFSTGRDSCTHEFIVAVVVCPRPTQGQANQYSNIKEGGASEPPPSRRYWQLMASKEGRDYV